MSKHFFKVDDQQPYTPDGHSHTENRILFNKKRTDSDSMELIFGEMHPGAVADEHVHNQCDQGVYVISGSAKFIVGGEEALVGAGSAIFIPRNISHKAETVGKETLKMLVFYTPHR